MKSRHAGALALVGWHLITPSANASEPGDTSGPLTQWSVEGTFDTAYECQKNNPAKNKSSHEQFGRVADEEWAKDHPGESVSYEFREKAIQFHGDSFEDGALRLRRRAAFQGKVREETKSCRQIRPQYE
jgi:hypothetical protein